MGCKETYTPLICLGGNIIMQNTFSDYNPNSADLSFDRDDLVGIALNTDDPIFQRDVVLMNMYNGIIDEAVVPNEINAVTKAIEDGIEVEETVPEVDLENMELDDSDVSYDGMDAEEEIDAVQAIMSGEADEDMELVDLADSMD